LPLTVNGLLVRGRGAARRLGFERLEDAAQEEVGLEVGGARHQVARRGHSIPLGRLGSGQVAEQRGTREGLGEAAGAHLRGTIRDQQRARAVHSLHERRRGAHARDHVRAEPERPVAERRERLLDLGGSRLRERRARLRVDIERHHGEAIPGRERLQHPHQVRVAALEPRPAMAERGVEGDRDGDRRAARGGGRGGRLGRAGATGGHVLGRQHLEEEEAVFLGRDLVAALPRREREPVGQRAVGVAEGAHRERRPRRGRDPHREVAVEAGLLAAERERPGGNRPMP
jgi:hypothetical protein